ncbi:MAG: hypothetical protein K9L86_04615 [Candidatus Omnitrophica bacterium]|nr:hypothetical protein [Candidatus Omnitrophota bacterium]
MKEKVFDRKEKYIFFIGSIFLLIYLTFYISSNYRANCIYENLSTFQKPDLNAASLSYYRKVLKSVFKAIKISPDKADYYAKKGDYLLEAKEEGLADELSIDKVQIESLYKKAIRLNPTNFDYHLRLGRFYTIEGDERAKSELIKATQLYSKDPNTYSYLFEYYLIKGLESELIKAAQTQPENPIIYLCLAKYYFSENQEKTAFINLISFFHYQKDKVSRYQAAQKISKKIKNVKRAEIDLEGRKTKLIVYPQAPEFFLKEEGFPQLEINLEIHVYANGPITGVTLYRGVVPQEKFRMIKRRDEPIYYRLRINNVTNNGSLDDFKISTNDGTVIEKIEFIKRF